MSTVEYNVPAGVEIVVRRPSGDVETIKHPTLKKINERQFLQMKKATEDAGRGVLLSYKNLVKTNQKNIEDIMTDADRAEQSTAEVCNAMTLNGTTY